jgi:Protein of unknown function (DUF3151)
VPDNLLGGPPDTLLPPDPAAESLDAGEPAEGVARANPASSLVWAVLAERALADGRDLDAYAYARVGYHRGLDALRRNGWRGYGPVPYEHVPNRGFLRALAALAKASALIGDTSESQRCAELLRDSTGRSPDELR